MLNNNRRSKRSGRRSERSVSLPLADAAVLVVFAVALLIAGFAVYGMIKTGFVGRKGAESRKATPTPVIR